MLKKSMSKTTEGRRLPEEWRPDHPVYAFHEDSNANATLVTHRGDVWAVAEERMTRQRFQGGFPQKSLNWLEQVSGVSLEQCPTLVFGNRTHFLPRLLGSAFPSFEHDFFGLAHKGMVAFQHLCFMSKEFSRRMEQLNRALLARRFGKEIVIVDHHHAHAASAYFCSGQTDACAISVDNYGDGFAAKVFDCDGPEISFRYGTSAACSPGQFYGEMAQIAGIAPLHAGKLTGMAASGDPGPGAATVRGLFDVTADGKDFTRTLDLARSPDQAAYVRLAALHKPDLAAAVQRQFEDALVKYVETAAAQTGRRHLVLAGGCFANVRLNQRALELPGVDSVYIHPAMSDQGISMGAALAYLAWKRKPMPFIFENIFLGPESTEEQMLAAMEAFGMDHERPDDMARRVAGLLVEGNVIARFDGPMEYGLRALGNRSILYQTQDPDLQARLNKKLSRAPYMPFCPVTMEPYAAQCYQDVHLAAEASRFMTISFHATDWMKEHSPGVVHIDGTVRPQVLRASDNPGMYRIIEEYHRITGNPSVMNTSFNMHSEPIVTTAHDACQAFVKADLDYLVLGPFLIRGGHTGS